MLLNYDFLELVDEPQRNTSLTASIDKALADKRLARQNKPKVKIKDGLSLSETLDAYGREVSRLKNQQETIKASTIESANLNSIVNKIKSGLPFGTISAFRPFKPVFEKDFTEKQQKALISAYKSGFDPKNADKVAQYWQNKPTKIDLHEPIKAKDFFKGNTNIYRTLRNLFGQKFMDSYIAPKSETTMRDFMSSDKFVKKYRYTQKDNIKRTQELKSLLDQKRHFLGYLQVTGYWKDRLDDPLLPSKEVSFFVFQNEPSNSFNLKDQLLDLANYFNQAAICYCDNAETGKVDLVLATEKDFGKVDWTFTGITFSAPNELPQSLTRLQDKVFTFFKKEDKDNYGVYFKNIVKTQIKAIRLPRDTEGLGVMDFVKSSIIARQNSSRANGYQQSFSIDEIEDWERKGIFDREKLKCLTSKSFRQSYNHNIKIRKVANAMRQGKKVSRTLLAKVLANTIDTDAGYCFISPTDLATQLDSISPRLSKSIVTAIEQAEGVRLTYALIDKITYNSLHNILSFVFDIDNPLSDQAFERLVIEVPREALKNVKLPQIKNVLTAQIFEGAYHFRGNDYKFKG
ncbi:hypothetical protein [Helicobacter pylori]|uniref:hypothetical protein n=1 Tax=Helicobacter pylori TaxID=210 RepID=UPI0019340F3A|nr:hypothetical protein [Helicobacter pylori]MBM0603421.1 hypothetical protein [Helicobacter pylori]MBM0613983.1 hypothetical protein [Helicobacter pylori]MBM0615352.1 hypothetical protein [Helicobacter pylori]MBM0618201.1 hypothetical protein [Helicobacter pylori]MBM0628664.1 hypothetical protein [Helicobacter pylori]